MAAHNPASINVMLDGWSAFHHGYLGVIITYIYDGKRYLICIGVIPFDDSHMAVALAAWLKELLDSWGITGVTDVITSDTAANMKALMRYIHVDGCTQTNSATNCDCFQWGACICHVLNLVVQKDVMTGVMIARLIEDCKEIAVQHNTSNTFAAAVRKAQIEVQGRTEDQCLVIKNDVKTRWNSTFLMLARLLEVKEAVQHLQDDEHWGEKIPFITAGNWQLMERLVTVLTDFHEATEMLSSRNTSIAEVISC